MEKRPTPEDWENCPHRENVLTLNKLSYKSCINRRCPFLVTTIFKEDGAQFLSCGSLRTKENKSIFKLKKDSIE